MQCRHFCTKTCRQHIYRSRKQIENSLQKKKTKKTSRKFCTKIPLCSSGQELRPECNVAVFTRIKKINWVDLLRKCRLVRQVKNFDWNAILLFLHENLQISYMEVQVTYRKFFRNRLKKKKKPGLHFLRKCPQICLVTNLNLMQCHRIIIKTCRQHVQRSKKQIENSLEKKNYLKQICTKMPLSLFGQEF